MNSLRRIALGCSAFIVLGVVSANQVSAGFEPVSPRAFMRWLGLGLGPGYHAYPCTKCQAAHYNRSVLGQTHPRAYCRHKLQNAKLPQVIPCDVPKPGRGMEAEATGHSISDYDHGPTAGSGPTIHPPTATSPERVPTPAKGRVTIPPMPTTPPSTRAHQGTTAPPREEPSLAPRGFDRRPGSTASPPDTGSPFQYDPRRPDSSPRNGVPATDSTGPELRQPATDFLRPDLRDRLPPPTSQSDPKVWW